MIRRQELLFCSIRTLMDFDALALDAIRYFPTANQ
jgi:hypothetical protein